MDRNFLSNLITQFLIYMFVVMLIWSLYDWNRKDR